MAIPKIIISLTNDIRKKIYGKDVRESIAKGLEVSGDIADNALSTSNHTKARQDDVENRFDDQMSKNTDINEVIDARRPEGQEAYPTLRRRLDFENNALTLELEEKPSMITYEEEVTVGSNGDFTSVNDAIKYFTKKHQTFESKVSIKLLSGFVMREQVLIFGMDLGWITLNSEDKKVMVDPEYLTTYFPTRGDERHYPLFGGAKGATIPYINGIVFDLQSTWDGANYYDGLALREGSRAAVNYNTGFINAGGNGVYMAYDCHLSGMSLDVSGAGQTGMRIRHNSHANFRSLCKANNCGLDGLEVYGHSSIFFRDSEAMHCKRNGIDARLAVVNAYNSNVSFSEGVGIYAQHSTVEFSYGRSKNCGDHALYSSDGSVIKGRFGVYSTTGDTQVCRAVDASEIDIPRSEVAAGSVGLSSVASKINAAYSLIRSSSGPSVSAHEGSQVNITKANCDNSVLSQSGSIISAFEADALRYQVIYGSIIQAAGAKGAMHNNPNEITSNGTIYN